MKVQITGTYKLAFEKAGHGVVQTGSGEPTILPETGSCFSSVVLGSLESLMKFLYRSILGKIPGIAPLEQLEVDMVRTETDLRRQVSERLGRSGVVGEFDLLLEHLFFEEPPDFFVLDTAAVLGFSAVRSFQTREAQEAAVGKFEGAPVEDFGNSPSLGFTRGTA